MATRPRGACGLQRAGRQRRKGTGSSSSNETAHLHGGVLGPHGLSGGTFLLVPFQLGDRRNAKQRLRAGV